MRPPSLRAAARALLHDLDRHRLDVVLVPAPFGNRMVRQAQDQNPDWYRALCSDYPSTCHQRRQRPDTLIKRHHTIAALTAIAEGKPCSSVYAARLLPYLTQEAATDECALPDLDSIHEEIAS